MMSIKNIAQANGKLHMVKPWHEKLSKIISPNAVYFIFLNAEINENIMFFENTEELDRAINYKNEVSRALPNVIMASRTQVIPWEIRQRY